VTPDQIIFQRRLRTLAAARELGNVTEARRRNGVSRTTFHERLSVASAYGLEALMPKARRKPQLPNAIPRSEMGPLNTTPIGPVHQLRGRMAHYTTSNNG
jgi:hypothetical protein